MKNLFRLIAINYTLARFGLDDVFLSFHYLRSLKILSIINPFNWFRSNQTTQAKRLRLCLESLGPIFIKFGQMLATRRDLLPEDIVIELEKLLDQVPPFPLQQALDIIEQQFGMPVEQAFLSFDDQVLASASIAQVYKAELHDGQKVVVKVVRPDIEKHIRQDTELLMMLATLVDRYWAESSRIKPMQIVAEFEKTLLNELDVKPPMPAS
jgi:ubiquinone biosynthesis protein